MKNERLPPRLLRSALTIVALSMAAGCAESPWMPAVIPSRRAIPLEVSDRAFKPRLARLTRHGDPSSAVALAIANSSAEGGGTLRNQALARLFAERLAKRGLSVVTTSDDLGIRVARETETPENARQFVATVREVLGTRVTEDEARALRRSLDTNPPRRTTAATVAVSACSGDAGVTMTATLPEATADAVETWRSESLRVGRVALGVVGPATAGQAVTESIEGGSPWSLRPAGPTTRTNAPSHRAVISAHARETSAALDIAWDLPDPRRALELAVALRGVPSPLGEKLALHAPNWSLAEVLATARTDGGCLRLRFEARELPRDKRVHSASAVVALAEHDVGAGLAWPPNESIVAETIAAAEDATSAAERAAWWALAAAGTREHVIVSSVLSLPPERGGLEGNVVELEAEYQSEVAANLRSPVTGGTRDLSATAKHLVEAGQRESWILVANECGASDESVWDAGRSALAAQTAAQHHIDDEVTVEPWIAVDGIGLLAHGAPRANESAMAFGRRIARAAGAALASVTFSDESFLRARANVLRIAARDDMKLLGQLGQIAFPNRPTLLAPFGLLEQVLATTREDAEDRWRSMLHEPWRMAMLASVDDDEARAAAQELSRWFAATRPTPCARHRNEALPEKGALRMATAVGPSRTVTSFTVERADDAPSLELVAALHGGKQGAGETAARVLGGSRSPTLLLETRRDGPGARPADLETLRTLDVSPRTFEGAHRRVLRERRRRRATPRGRVEALWSPGEGPLPALEDFRRWLRETLPRARSSTSG